LRSACRQGQRHQGGLVDPNHSGPDERGTIGADHLAYAYASLSDLLDHYAGLKANGIKPYWCVHRGITVAMYDGDAGANSAVDTGVTQTLPVDISLVLSSPTI
jgi:hypothetical protein